MKKKKRLIISTCVLAVVIGGAVGMKTLFFTEPDLNKVVEIAKENFDKANKGFVKTSNQQVVSNDEILEGGIIEEYDVDIADNKDKMVKYQDGQEIDGEYVEIDSATFYFTSDGSYTDNSIYEWKTKEVATIVNEVNSDLETIIQTIGTKNTSFESEEKDGQYIISLTEDKDSEKYSHELYIDKSSKSVEKFVTTMNNGYYQLTETVVIDETENLKEITIPENAQVIQ